MFFVYYFVKEVLTSSNCIVKFAYSKFKKKNVWSGGVVCKYTRNFTFHAFHVPDNVCRQKYFNFILKSQQKAISVFIFGSGLLFHFRKWPLCARA